jgi:dTDP-4-dehydrorhamnose reductase
MATGKGDCRLPFSGLDGFHYQPLDFTDPFEVHDLFASFQPQVVIHAGAMTQVDQCEKEQWQAYLVNVEGTVTLLMNAEEYKSFFLFVSTDFVFDGVKGD